MSSVNTNFPKSYPTALIVQAFFVQIQKTIEKKCWKIFLKSSYQGKFYALMKRTDKQTIYRECIGLE